MRNRVIITGIFLVLSLQVFGQINQDSSLNLYKRKYRTTLNTSDLVLIKQLVKEIETRGCSCYRENMGSTDYSGTFKAKITKDIFEKKLCIKDIYKLLNYRHNYPNSGRPHDPRNFPVYNLFAENEKLFDTFREMVLNFEEIKYCDWIENFGQKSSYKLRTLIHFYKWDIDAEIDSKSSTISDCHLSNLLELSYKK